MDHAPGNGRHTRKCLWLFLLMLNLQPRPYPPFCKIAYRAWSGAERNQVVFIIVTRKISKMVKLFVKYIIIEGGMLTVKKKKNCGHSETWYMIEQFDVTYLKRRCFDAACCQSQLYHQDDCVRRKKIFPSSKLSVCAWAREHIFLFSLLLVWRSRNPSERLRSSRAKKDSATELYNTLRR